MKQVEVKLSMWIVDLKMPLFFWYVFSQPSSSNKMKLSEFSYLILPFPLLICSLSPSLFLHSFHVA